jgi:hypothetical protein
MIETVVQFFQKNWGTHASVFVLVIVVPIIIIAALRKNAFEIGDIILLALGTAGFASGIRILVLTLGLEDAQLGSLADDKPTLILGGIAAVLATGKEMWGGTRKVTGI